MIARYGQVSNRVGGLHLRKAPKVDPDVKPLDALNPGDRVFVFYPAESDANWVRVLVLKSQDKGWVSLKDHGVDTLDLDPVAPPVLDTIETAPLWPYYVGAVLFVLAIAAGAYYW